MKFNEITQQAYLNNELSRLSKPYERLTHIALSFLYQLHKNDIYDLQIAGAKKLKIQKYYDELESVYDDYIDYSKQWQADIMATSELRSAFHKAKKDGADDSELLKIAMEIVYKVTNDVTFKK